MSAIPLIENKSYDRPSLFEPLNLLREARRQKKLADGTVPHLCMFDPDGDLAGYLQHGGRASSTILTPFEFMDLKVGRQILTWGTGDYIFINDLFPKDYNSFFIGRDDEYLKAPSDALKASFYTTAISTLISSIPRNSIRIVSLMGNGCPISIRNWVDWPAKTQ